MKTLSFLTFLSLFLFSSCLSVKEFLPPGGQEGDLVTVEGKGFSSNATVNEVYFGNQEANVLEASRTTLKVAVPPGVTRSKIKVKKGSSEAESDTEFIPTPEFLQYYRFESQTLGVEKGYWVMYPPGYEEAGHQFPVVYLLHGYHFEVLRYLDLFGLDWHLDPDEHQLIFASEAPGMYFPFIAYYLMESNSVDEFRQSFATQMEAFAGQQDRHKIDEMVESIIYYLPENPDSWLPDLEEMILVFADGDNSWYVDRKGPPGGRNADGIGLEPSFPSTQDQSPAGRMRLHTTGWHDTYFMQDLIPEVEGSTIPAEKLVEEEKRRFVAGVSMGGGGSLTFAMRYPDDFVGAAALGIGAATTDELISPERVIGKNKWFPEYMDAFGSAPIKFNASLEEVTAQIQLDRDHVSAYNPWDLAEAIGGSDLHILIETGENDALFDKDEIIFERLQGLIERMQTNGIHVEGGLVPAAAAGEPQNGGANHLPEFFRTRFGVVLKFFSDAYNE